MSAPDQHIIDRLRQEILLLQGFKPHKTGRARVDLGPVASAFPNRTFPVGALHEFISTGPQKAAATSGFIAAVTSSLLLAGGACIWIARERKVYPPGLVTFGVQPERVVFIQARKEKELWWLMEEALQQPGLAAVVGDLSEISLTASRRLQLAIERTDITAFLIRDNPRNLNPIASIARWRISPVRSRPAIPGMPGIGHPKWKVELLKVKNGHPGSWQVEWSAGRFQPILPDLPALQREQQRKTG